MKCRRVLLTPIVWGCQQDADGHCTVGAILASLPTFDEPSESTNASEAESLPGEPTSGLQSLSVRSFTGVYKDFLEAVHSGYGHHGDSLFDH